MRRLALALAGAVALAALGSGPAAVAAEPKLTRGEATFPWRHYVLSAPSGVDPGAVRVRENGGLVADLSVEAADASGGRELGVVLVIDASKSMRGEPIRAAMEAARAFARRRNPEQPLAVVAFSRTPRVLLPFTTDRARIRRALAAPPALGRSTQVYDATATAVRLLREAGIAAGSVVVLSDGDDTGSRASIGDVAAAARETGARIFTVGLESGAFDPKGLRRLAAAAGGRYGGAARPRDLERIFDALAAELAAEYLLRWRSLAPPGRSVRVAVELGASSDTLLASYRTPARPGAAGPGPFERSAAETFWRSPLAMVLVSLVAALGIALAVVALVRPSGRALHARLAGFVADPERPEGEEAGGRSGGRLSAIAERVLARTSWWAAFCEEVEIARITIPPLRIVAGTALLTAVAAWLLAAIGPLLVPLAAVVPLVVRSLVRNRLRRQRNLFADQLAENLQVIASAMRAGHSLGSAFSVVVQEAAEPSEGEFRRVVADEQLGVPLETALQKVADRMESRDLEQVGLVAALQRETGGNTAEVLDRVSETIRARNELRRLVQTLTAQGRMSRWIITFLPVTVLALVTMIDPDYLEPVWSTTSGNLVLAVSAFMTVLGSLFIKRIVEIKV